MTKMRLSILLLGLFTVALATVACATSTVTVDESAQTSESDAESAPTDSDGGAAAEESPTEIPEPTAEPTEVHTTVPTAVPTEEPTSAPKADSAEPVADPTAEPTSEVETPSDTTARKKRSTQSDVDLAEGLSAAYTDEESRCIEKLFAESDWSEQERHTLKLLIGVIAGSPPEFTDGDVARYSQLWQCAPSERAAKMRASIVVSHEHWEQDMANDIATCVAQGFLDAAAKSDLTELQNLLKFDLGMAERDVEAFKAGTTLWGTCFTPEHAVYQLQQRMLWSRSAYYADDCLIALFQDINMRAALLVPSAETAGAISQLAMYCVRAPAFVNSLYFRDTDEHLPTENADCLFEKLGDKLLADFLRSETEQEAFKGHLETCLTQEQRDIIGLNN